MGGGGQFSQVEGVANIFTALMNIYFYKII